MKKGGQYEGIIERIDFPNKGILWVEEEKETPEGTEKTREKVIVKNGIPGQKVRVVITKRRKGKSEGTILEVLSPSPLETAKDPCCHFGTCGGCLYQTIPYEEQLNIKEGQVKSLLEQMCPVYTEDNLIGARWTKLLINATFSGLGTVVGGLFGNVSEDRDVRPVALRCMKECMDVGFAAGVHFAPVQGKDITRLFYYKNGLKKAFALALIPYAMKEHRDIEPSMLQDLKKGKPCEVEAINGVVCEWGRKYGVPTPVNDRIVEVIRREQAGELKLVKSNIQFFSDLV